jgi:hypothetical protein
MVRRIQSVDSEQRFDRRVPQSAPHELAAQKRRVADDKLGVWPLSLDKTAHPVGRE